MATASGGVELTFVLDQASLAALARIVGQHLDDRSVRAAARHAQALAQDWRQFGSIATEAIGRLALLEHLPGVDVIVLPPEFMVGASEISQARIYIGQPIRHPGYGAALLAHELTHLAMARGRGGRAPSAIEDLTEEVLSFVCEAHVHWDAARLRLADVWAKSALDDHHRAAIELAGVLVEATDRSARGTELVSIATDMIAVRELPPKTTGLRALLENERAARGA